MLTHLRIRNFKAWKDTGAVRLAPLTVIFGANSAGKSSLGHLLLALQQTVRSSERRRALHLGDDTTPVDLGTFADCLHGHELRSVLGFELGWKLHEPLEVLDPLSARRYRGDGMRLDVELSAGKDGQPEVTRMQYRLRSGENDELDVRLERDARGRFSLSSRRYDFEFVEGRERPLEAPEKFHRLSDTSIACFRNAGFMRDFALATEAMLTDLSCLGPLRRPPARILRWSGEAPSSVGQMGEHTVAAILAAQSQGRRLGVGVKAGRREFMSFIAAWLRKLGIIHDFSVRPLAEGRREYEVLVRTHARAPEVGLGDVGFGISQLLPALVQAFYCPPGSTVWMDQPGASLHPQLQSTLADVFISAIHAREDARPRNVQLIVESHSEYFLNRLQRRVAERMLTPEQVAVHFCRNTRSGAELEPLRLNSFGEIENWPENFFGDEMEDIAARTRAAMQRRRELAGGSTP